MRMMYVIKKAQHHIFVIASELVNLGSLCHELFDMLSCLNTSKVSIGIYITDEDQASMFTNPVSCTIYQSQFSHVKEKALIVAMCISDIIYS